MTFLIIVGVIIFLIFILNQIAKHNRYAPALKPGQSALGPQAQMLTMLNKVAHETTDMVMNIYTRKVNSGSLDPLYDTARTLFSEDGANTELCKTIEGICYAFGSTKLPESMMSMRWAQFCAMVNDCLLKKPNKPYTSQEALIRGYELLGLKDIYDRSPKLFQWNNF